MSAVSFAARPQLIVMLCTVSIVAMGMLWARQPAAQPQVRQRTRPPLPLVVLPPTDCTQRACVALTFDDGPSASVTPQILAVLAKHKARATFFVVGSHVHGNEELLRRMYTEGHEIGNHSWSHPDLTAVSPSDLHHQINDTQRAIADTGVPAPTLFRPPYGAVNAVVSAHVPMTFILWNVDSEDWRHKDAGTIAAFVDAHAGPGRVVLFHDTHQPTADALDHLLASLGQRYTFVTATQLFNLTPGQRGVFYGR